MSGYGIREFSQVLPMTLIIHVTLSESFSFSSYPPALKCCCELEGNVGIPVKVCCRLGHALKHEL